MMVFLARTGAQGLDFLTRTNHERFLAFCRENPNIRLRITPDLVESKHLRRYFEGGIIAALCEYTDGYDRRNPADREAMRDLVMREFNGELRHDLHGRTVRVARPSKGREALNALVERVTDYMAENGIPVPDPALFKRWRDEFSSDVWDFYDWLDMHNLRPDGSVRAVELRQ